MKSPLRPAFAIVLVIAGCSQGPATQEARTVPGDTAAAVSAVATAPVRRVAMEVGGMVCEACVIKVRHQLKQVPGVQSVVVSLADQRAEVVCDATVADTSLTRAVRSAGPAYIGLIIAR